VTDFHYYWLFGATSLIYVFLKAFQQLNVFHNRYWWIMPASCGMCACEFFLIIKTTELNPGWGIMFGGSGAGLGCLAAMYLSRRFK
jgi:hypothetical protein